MMTHILIALIIQACTAVLLAALGFELKLGLLVGAAAGMWNFIGREVAQAEYRGIHLPEYDGKRGNTPWHIGLQPRCWNLKSALDVLSPSAAVFAVCVIAWAV